MRKISVLTFMTLDGVMQSPGGPEEDTSGGFEYGGWGVPHFDEHVGRVMDEQMSEPFDLLLGRKTYDLFAAYWPQHKEEAPGINNAIKYVATRTAFVSEWEKTVLLSDDIVRQIQELKASEGPEIQVHGSSNLIQTLMQHRLIDEFKLKIFPVVIGKGKRLFAEGTIPVAFELENTETSPSGVIIANYRCAGNVQIGSF